MSTCPPGSGTEPRDCPDIIGDAIASIGEPPTGVTVIDAGSPSTSSSGLRPTMVSTLPLATGESIVQRGAIESTNTKSADEVSVTGCIEHVAKRLVLPS